MSDFVEITEDTARALIKAHHLQSIQWSTLDSVYFFKEIEWADEAKTQYAFPGKDPWVIMDYYMMPDMRWKAKASLVTPSDDQP